MKTTIEAMERSPIPSNFIAIQSTPESLRLSSLSPGGTVHPKSLSFRSTSGALPPY
jgi:hypothetical protein